MRLGAPGASLPGAFVGVGFGPVPCRLPPWFLGFLPTSRAAAVAFRFPSMELDGSLRSQCECSEKDYQATFEV